MVGLLLVMVLVGLLIELVELLAPYWPLILAVTAVYGVWRWIIFPAREARAIEVRDRLRHERARREIDRITLETSRAMCEAARNHGDVIEGTAVEVMR
ncbi:MAG: hypothetical protein H0X28_16105 [Solirubrobacterales bacterium]|nr:hypothetical protein [Solirubrobacterales bacterium]